MLADLFKLISENYGTAIGLVFLIWATLAVFVHMAQPGTRSWSRMRVLARRMSLGYDARMDRLMGGLKRLLKPESVDDVPRSDWTWRNPVWWTTPLAASQADADAMVRQPWSWPVLDAAMRIGVAYPILLAMGTWTLTGAATGLGGFDLFPDRVGWGWRYALFCLIVGGLVSFILATALSKGIFEKLSIGLLLSAFTLTVAFSLAFSGPADDGVLAGAVALGLVLAFSTAFSGALAFALPVGFTAAFTLTVALLVAVTASSEVKLALPLVVIFGSLAVGVMIAVGFTFTLAVGRLVPFFTLRGASAGRLAYLALLVSAGLGSSFSLRMGILKEDLGFDVWTVGLVLLPSVNIFFDWLSYGTTIWLLRMGLVDTPLRGLRRIGFGFADLCAAGVLFLALAASLVVVLEYVNAGREMALVDVSAILRDPAGHLWVVLMVGSTLLPTMVHLILAIFAVVTVLPRQFWVKLVLSVNSEKDPQLS